MCNTECVIVFQTVISQRVRLITGTKNIFAQIDDRFDSWNSGDFDEVVYDSYTAATGYLGRSCMNKSAEQRHYTFLNFVLCGKLREAIIFICKR